MCVHEDLSLVPKSTLEKESGLVVCTYNPSTEETEKGMPETHWSASLKS